MDRISFLGKMFFNIHFNHINREKNRVADCLSKKGLQSDFGNIHYEWYDYEKRGTTGTINFL